MSITLRPPIELFFASENAHDPSPIDECFEAGAVVQALMAVTPVIVLPSSRSGEDRKRPNCNQQRRRRRASL